jgi:hypothetical protein
MRKLLAYIFLTIFSFQVLPVKEIGKILFKGMMTEEIHETCHNADDTPGSKLKKGAEPFKLINSEASLTAQILYLDRATETAIHEAERLPNNFVPDIFTPPPNC